MVFCCFLGVNLHMLDAIALHRHDFNDVTFGLDFLATNEYLPKKG